MKVRKQLKYKSLQEIAVELEKCLSLPEEDRIFAVKNMLAGSVNAVEINRDTSDNNDEMKLLDLAEELLEKMAEILANPG